MPIPISGRVVEALRHSTVCIRSKLRNADGCGSGVALHDDLVITNAHVVTGPECEVESWEGRTASARLLRIDRARDLALLQAAGLRAAAAQLGDSDLMRPGMPVLAVGNPLGFTGALSSGVIHSQPVSVPGSRGGGAGLYRWVCADVRLAPGNSGGPLADAHGHVIGINTMVVSGGLALAVPSRSVQIFLKSPVQWGITARPVATGLLLLQVTPGSAADLASLLPGDVLVAVNGKPLRVAEDLQFASQDTEILSVEFVRGGDRKVRRVAVRLPQQASTTAA